MEYTYTKVQIALGYGNPIYETAYRLSNGTVLLSSERDTRAYFTGAVGLDGMYLRTNSFYKPLYDHTHQIYAFEKVFEPHT